MTEADLDALLAEQVAYYRARAVEYDQTSPLRTDERSRAKLANALEAFAPQGRVLEIACGTGQWTGMLAETAAELTAIDASPEMLAIAAGRVQGSHVRLIQADIFQWRPDQLYDLVFFSAWPSHVPPQWFERFWLLVAECLDQTGRFFMIDELQAVKAHERVLAGTAAPAVSRALNSGARHRTVKVFYEPEELRARLRALGWDTSIHQVGWRFFYATGKRRNAAQSQTALSRFSRARPYF